MKKLLYFYLLIFCLNLFCLQVDCFMDGGDTNWFYYGDEIPLIINEEIKSDISKYDYYIYKSTITGILEIKYTVFTDVVCLSFLKHRKQDDVHHYVELLYPLDMEILNTPLWRYYYYSGLDLYSNNVADEGGEKIEHKGTLKFKISPGIYYFLFKDIFYHRYTNDEFINFTATFTPDPKTSPETGIDNVYPLIGVFLLSVGGAVIIKRNRRVKL